MAAAGAEVQLLKSRYDALKADAGLMEYFLENQVEY